MLDEQKIYAGLNDIFADVFMRDDIVLRPDLTARDVKDWNSFKQVEIIMATEQHFAVRLTSADVDGLRCVGDLVAIIAKRAK